MTGPSPVLGLQVCKPGTIKLLPAHAVPASLGGAVAPDLGPLGPHEVSGPTVCTVVSPGTEIATSFQPPPGVSGAPLPWIPGYAAVFEVAQVGSDVTKVEPGDLVYSLGGHRTHQREFDDAVWRLPDGMDPFVAVFARLMSIPMTSLSMTGARPGATVGVAGLGPIGHFATVAFALSGYRVVAWDPVEARRALLPVGIETAADAPHPTPRRQYGGTEGFDVVLECSGNDGAAMAAVRAVRPSGEVFLIGTPWQQRTDATAFELLREVFLKYAVLRSGWEWQIPALDPPFRAASASQNVTQALRWLADGKVRVDHLAKRHRPDQAQQVYERFANATATELTALFDWREFANNR